MEYNINMTVNGTHSSNGSLDSNQNLSSQDYPFYMDTGDRATAILSKPNNAIAMIFGTCAVLANVLSLCAIYQIRRGITSHLRIVISLIASDLLVDASLIGHIINTVFHPLLEPGFGTTHERLQTRCSFITLKAFNTTGLNITLLNLVALAVDHYIAILKPFQLPTLLSTRRTITMILIMWIVALISGFSDFFSVLKPDTNMSNFNICERIWLSSYHEEFVTFFIVAVSFVSLFYMYLHIYCEVKGKHFSDTVNDIKRHRNKRALITTLLILGTFVICWLPICIFNIVLIIIIKGGVSIATIEHVVPILTMIDAYLYDLMLLNTLCDPIIYAIRIQDVQRGYKLLLNKCLRRKKGFLRSRHSYMDNTLPLETRISHITKDIIQTNDSHIQSHPVYDAKSGAEIETLIDTGDIA